MNKADFNDDFINGIILLLLLLLLLCNWPLAAELSMYINKELNHHHHNLLLLLEKVAMLVAYSMMLPHLLHAAGNKSRYPTWSPICCHLPNNTGLVLLHAIASRRFAYFL
jgi:hypothetical protein